MGYIILSALIAIFILILRSPRSRGRRGEASVRQRLQLLPKEKYHVLNDIVLKTSNGLAQIDHVVVSEYGVFVIETKNYSGWIFGSETNPYWTQNIYGKKTSFYNPILQNKGHVAALSSLLAQFGYVKIVPIVAFANKCDLKNRHILRSEVVYFSELRRTIVNYSDTVMTSEKVAEIVSCIQSQNQTSDESRKHQRSFAKTQSYHYDHSLNQGRCPRCGGELVLRQGKYGKFYGCSNYPKCRYTIKY